MYKYLLCWRYLLTRYLALACIVSVMLGVATLIVVNSIMSGFSTKLKDRLHGILADVLINSYGLEGMADPEGKMERIRNSPIGDKIVAMAPAQEIFAIMQFHVHDMFRDEVITRSVRLIGIDPEPQSRVDGFASYLEGNQPEQPESPPRSWWPWQKDPGESARRPLKDPTRCFELSAEAKERQAWLHPPMLNARFPQRTRVPGELPEPDAPPSREKVAAGIIIGHAIAHFRVRDEMHPGKYKEICMIPKGHDVVITTVGGQRLTPVYDRFAAADYFKSEMSEYDSNYVYVPLAHLQKLRSMEDRVTGIQIKLKNYDRDSKEVTKTLEEMFPQYEVATWEKKQGALLAAIDIERGLLNVLLFLIICVAGFGILAIFSMIVVEKTRDIGILKALGASNGGIMKIFLGYGLLLGIVGAAIGTILGLGITIYINEIEAVLTKVTGTQIFNREVYYFKDIPTNVQPFTVLLVNVGAIGIAVLFSVLPALRAALLHPVRALRYE